VLLGCGCLSIVAAGAVALVVVNWSTLEGVFRSASAGMSELFAVRAALQEEYDTAEVAVLSRRHMKVPEPILVVRMVNPPFLSLVPSGKERDKALEVARFAHDKLKNPASYGSFEVTFTRRVSLGASASMNQVFTFSAAELESGDVR
jgi:hypothetical protein